MEFNPKNYHQFSFSDPELAFRAENKNIRGIRRELRRFGMDRAIVNLLIQEGYRGSEEIYDAPDIVLLSIRGIGRKRLSKIRQTLLPFYLRAI